MTTPSPTPSNRDADDDDVRTRSGEPLPSGPGATAGLPGENSGTGAGTPVEELRDTTLAGDVAPPGDPDVR